MLIWNKSNKIEIDSIQPYFDLNGDITAYCVSFNNGGYSIILQTFLCRADWDLQAETNETTNIRWKLVDIVKKCFLKVLTIFIQCT